MKELPQLHVTRGRRLVAVLCWAGVVLGTLFVLWTSLGRRENLNDDMLITLTYAKNIALGRGFVYNHPPSTLGTTTPLFAIAIGLIGRLFRHADLVHVAVSLSSMCWIGVGWLLFLNRRTFRLRDYEATMLVLVCFTFTQRFFYSGSEYMPFQFLLLSAVLFFLHRHMLLCGVLLGMLPLLRGEGFLLLPLLGAAHAYRLGPGIGLWRPNTWPAALRAAWRGWAFLLIGPTIIFAVWAGYALPTFGMLLPNTLHAKVLQGEMLDPDATRFLTQLVLDFPAWVWVDGWPITSVLLYALGFAGFAGLIRTRSPLTLLFFWALIFIVGYTALGVPGIYGWYQIPVYYVWLLCVGAGLVFLTRWLLSKESLPSSLRVTLVVVALLWSTVPIALQSARGTVSNSGDPRAGGYKLIAQWLRQNAQPRQSVAAKEVGYLGYYTDHPILDLSGLVSPEVLALLATHDRDSLLKQFSPDFFIQVTPRANAISRGPLNLGSVKYQPVMHLPMLNSFEPRELTLGFYRKAAQKTAAAPIPSTSP